MWLGLCDALELPALPDDERFRSGEDRREHAAELATLLEPAALRFGSAALLLRLSERGVPAAPINSVAETLADPHVRARGMVVEQHRGGESVWAVGDPLKISDGRATPRVPPRLGADTADVLRDLGGYADSAIDELVSAAAVGPAKVPLRVAHNTSQDTEHGTPARSA
jgi:crotonobetainyl-CoA:carnitine CoA-transferase CaiB-like acyl-CoA transferase